MNILQCEMLPLCILQEEVTRKSASPPDTKIINAILNIRTEDASWTPQQESMFIALRRTYKNDFCKLAAVLNLAIQNAPPKTCREVLPYLKDEIIVIAFNKKHILEA